MNIAVRFDFRIDAEEKDVIAKAAALMGTTMAGFVRAAAMEKAQQLLAREARITLSQQNFAAFAAALDGAFSPNAALQKAITQTP
jgi:uncharacterized protein (DUF1778 family)